MKKLLSFILISIFFQNLISSCGSKNNCELSIGYWEITSSNHKGTDKFSIHKEGDNYIFESLDFDPRFGKDFKSGLTCENKKIFLKGIPMISEMEFTPLEEGKKLLFGGNTYIKKHFEKIYYNSKWKVTNDTINASFYRINNYKEGLKIQPTKDYYKSGQIQMIGTFNAEGHNEDLFIWYNENGKKNSEINFHNGKYHGKKLVFHENEKLFEESFWDDGKLIKIKKFDSFGEPLKVGTFKNGTGSVIIYDYNNNPISAEFYIDGILERKSNFKNESEYFEALEGYL